MCIRDRNWTRWWNLFKFSRQDKSFITTKKDRKPKKGFTTPSLLHCFHFQNTSFYRLVCSDTPCFRSFVPRKIFDHLPGLRDHPQKNSFRVWVPALSRAGTFKITFFRHWSDKSLFTWRTKVIWFPTELGRGTNKWVDPARKPFDPHQDLSPPLLLTQSSR